MEIRVATPADVAAIAHLHAESWRLAYRGVLSDEYLAGDVVADRKSLWAQRLSTPNSSQYVVVVEINAQLTGFACVLADADPAWGALLDNIHVAQSHQRKGVGGALMRQVARWHLQYHPTITMFLWVLQSNVIAQQFYESLGAVKVGVDIWVPPGGGAVPRFRYAWSDVGTLLQGD